MIILAVCENNYVYAYNEHREKILNVAGELYNYTDNTVAIKRGEFIIIFDKTGNEIAKYTKDFIDLSNIIGIYK